MKTTLDANKIQELLSGRRASSYTDLSELWTFLEEESFFGTLFELSIEMGIPESRVSRAVGITRRTDWKQTFGWTIPYVKKGPGPKEWRVADSKDDYPLLHDGNRIRNDDIASSLERLESHFELEYKLAPTRSGKERARSKALYMRHAIELMELNGAR